MEIYLLAIIAYMWCIGIVTAYDSCKYSADWTMWDTDKRYRVKCLVLSILWPITIMVTLPINIVKHFWNNV